LQVGIAGQDLRFDRRDLRAAAFDSRVYFRNLQR
jgi:hypothetical protein